VYASAQAEEKKNVPAQITTAQTILESDWGKIVLTDVKKIRSAIISLGKSARLAKLSVIMDP